MVKVTFRVLHACSVEYCFEPCEFCFIKEEKKNKSNTKCPNLKRSVIINGHEKTLDRKDFAEDHGSDCRADASTDFIFQLICFLLIWILNFGATQAAGLFA